MWLLEVIQFAHSGKLLLFFTGIVIYLNKVSRNEVLLVVNMENRMIGIQEKHLKRWLLVTLSFLAELSTCSAEMIFHNTNRIYNKHCIGSNIKNWLNMLFSKFWFQNPTSQNLTVIHSIFSLVEYSYLIHKYLFYIVNLSYNEFFTGFRHWELNKILSLSIFLRKNNTKKCQQSVVDINREEKRVFHTWFLYFI